MRARQTAVLLLAMQICLLSRHGVTETNQFKILNTAAERDYVNLLFVGPSSSNSYLILQSPDLSRMEWSPVGGVSITALGARTFLARLPKPVAPLGFYRVMSLSHAPDLVGWFGAVSFPTDIVAGIGASGSAALVILNQGNEVVPPVQTPSILMSARPLGGGADLLLLNLANQLEPGLAPGHFQILNFNFALPTNILAGNYRLVAMIDALNVVSESSEDNNEAVDPITRRVAPPFVDLFTRIKLTSLSASVRAGDVGSATLTLGNDGNVLAFGQIDLDIFASKDTVLGPEDTLLGRVTNYVVLLPPRKATDLGLKIQFPIDIHGDQ